MGRNTIKIKLNKKNPRRNKIPISKWTEVIYFPRSHFELLLYHLMRSYLFSHSAHNLYHEISTSFSSRCQINFHAFHHWTRFTESKIACICNQCLLMQTIEVSEQKWLTFSEERRKKSQCNRENEVTSTYLW